MSRSVLGAALVSTALVACVGALQAQAARDRGGDPFRVGVSLGPSLLGDYALHGASGFGIHAQISGLWRSSPRVTVRADGMAQMLPGAAAEPSCIPGAPCRGYALQPDQLYSASLGAEVRPFGAVPRLFGTAGAGVYYGRGPEATSFGSTFGLSGGAGLDLARSGHAGFALEARYHYLASRFGLLRAMVTPSVSYRF